MCAFCKNYVDSYNMTSHGFVCKLAAKDFVLMLLEIISESCILHQGQLKLSFSD